MRVFWPTRGQGGPSGIVVGWTVEDTLCVVSIVGQWLDEHEPTPEPPQGRTDIVRPLRRLGSAVQAGAPESETGETFWIDRRGRVVSCSQPIEVVYYTPPDPVRLRFLTLGASTGTTQRANGIGWSQDGVTDEVVQLINGSRAVQERLRGSSHSGVRSIAFLLASWAAHLLGIALNPARLVVSALVWGCSLQLNVAGHSLPSLRYSSVFLAQLCLRLDQLLHGPRAFQATLAHPNVTLAERSKLYMSFWNTAWLVLNDMILGYAARTMILDLSGLLQASLPALFEQCTRAIVDSLQWLNDWPVGLKLNTPLSQFFCTALGWIVSSWGARLLPALAQAMPIVTHIFAAVSIAGLTFTLALASDALSLLTLHILVCHRLLAALCAWQLDSLSGLWNLFRGKRWNVLRQRTDSYEYEVDQLFLGTLLFTVSAFLFPTVVVYAGLFVLAHSVIFACKATLRLAVIALNAFPLFEVLLRVKEPSRLPAGIILQPVSSSRVKGTRGYPVLLAWELRDSPKSLVGIFLSGGMTM